MDTLGDRLARKVLVSLQALDTNISSLRASVAKIDGLARASHDAVAGAAGSDGEDGSMRIRGGVGGSGVRELMLPAARREARAQAELLGALVMRLAAASVSAGVPIEPGLARDLRRAGIDVRELLEAEHTEDGSEGGDEGGGSESERGGLVMPKVQKRGGLAMSPDPDAENHSLRFENGRQSFGSARGDGTEDAVAAAFATDVPPPPLPHLPYVATPHPLGVDGGAIDHGEPGSARRHGGGGGTHEEASVYSVEEITEDVFNEMEREEHDMQVARDEVATVHARLSHEHAYGDPLSPAGMGLDTSGALSESLGHASNGGGGLDADLADAEAAHAAAAAAAAASEYTVFNLRVVHAAGKTGFEKEEHFNAPVGTIIAAQYEVTDYLGTAAFSSALRCRDLKSGEDVCLKVIKNVKDFFDQSLDEIKLLRYLNSRGDADDHHVLRLIDYYYYKEHLFIVTELLKENLYEFQTIIDERGHEQFFTMGRVQRIARQALEALSFVHGNGIIHCDLKPENILVKSYSNCDIKIIDFGSSCFVTDHSSFYVQSRSYRAPEVILALPFDTHIDVWSLGCILAELLTGKVLFPNDTVPIMLARMIGLFGPFPEHMLRRGRDVSKYFTMRGQVYARSETGSVMLLKPVQTTLAYKLQCDDDEFVDFLSNLLTVDPALRPGAAEALKHPWLSKSYAVDKYTLPTA